MGIVVVEKKVSLSLSGCKVEEEEVVGNKTWREASEKKIEFCAGANLSFYIRNSLEDKTIWPILEETEEKM